MNETAIQELSHLFQALRREVPSVAGLALVSSDGCVVHQDWHDAMEADKAGAITAALLGLGKKAIDVCSAGEFQTVVVQSTTSAICVYGAGEEAVLMALLTGHAELGLLNYQARATCRLIALLLAGDQ
jgi:uncharacterized protein